MSQESAAASEVGTLTEEGDQVVWMGQSPVRWEEVVEKSICQTGTKRTTTSFSSDEHDSLDHRCHSEAGNQNNQLLCEGHPNRTWMVSFENSELG